MKLSEYKQVKDLNYREYCCYLQKKYGVPTHSYMDEHGNPVLECLRTSEGLDVHHVYEFRCDTLNVYCSTKRGPSVWQEPQNLVYADYLEHVFLHVLIAEFDPSNTSTLTNLIGDLLVFYSGGRPRNADFLRMCGAVQNELDTYVALVARAMRIEGFPDISTIMPSIDFLEDYLRADKEPVIERIHKVCAQD